MNWDSCQNFLSKETLTILPGVYDALSAKLAAAAGAKIAVVTGFSVSATQLGEPDFGLMSQTEILMAARTICRAVDIPILVDGDTGYGGPLNVRRLVQELIAMGAAGVILEDQAWPKRCGHLQGKMVVTPEEHMNRIAAAKAATGTNSFLIIARTDALAIHGVDNAIERGLMYMDAGADMIFVEAPTSLIEIQKITANIPYPLLLNQVEGGKTPLLSRSQISELGYSAVTYPLTGIFSAAKALAYNYSCLIQQEENISTHSLMTFDEFNAVIGLSERMAFAKKFE